MRKYSYLLAYILLMAIPSAVVMFFVWHQINITALIIVVMIAFLIGGVFDIWATRQGKKDKFYLWEYNRKTTLNKNFMGMEIEDVTLFLFLTPIFTIGTWEETKVLVAKHSIPIIPLVIGGIAIIFVSYFLTLHLFHRVPTKKRKKSRK